MRRIPTFRWFPTFVVSAAVLVLAAPAAAHSRNYVTIGSNGVVTCVDDHAVSVATYNVENAFVGAIVGHVDPITPDVGGTCYRAGHIQPNWNGDVTFMISDAVNTNVAGCVSQDTNGDHILCGAGDARLRFCNSGTVNAFDSPWHFDSLDTYVLVDGVIDGWAVSPFYRLESACGCSVIGHYGTTGTVSHS